MDTKELSFGEKAVGLTFNPSGDERVNKVKRLYAEIIDLIVNELGEEAKVGMTVNLSTLVNKSITEAQSAQMWAVKALTWKD